MRKNSLKKTQNINFEDQILVFLDQTGYQNRCNSGKLWFKPELRKNIIIRNPDRFKINAFGSYSPNGNSVLQFKETSKTLDIMTFLCETRKVNTKNEQIAKKLDILLNKYYNDQNKIIKESNKIKFVKQEIREELAEQKFDDLKIRIQILKNEYKFLLDKYREKIYPFVISSISEKNIANEKVLKRDKLKKERIQGEISLAKDLVNIMENDYWLSDFENEKTIVIFLDNTTIHRTVLTNQIVKSLNIKLIHLPKYASDLNPIERLWYSIKGELSTEFIENINYLKDQFHSYFYKFTQTSSLAKKFLQKFII
jgi:hypothetical protein